MRVPGYARTALLLLFWLCASPCQAQIGQVIEHPEAIAGPWEATTPDGVVGIWIELQTHIDRLPEDATPRPQYLDALEILLYRHKPSEDELADRGWFLVGANGGAAWDGRHLRLESASRAGWPGTHVDLAWNNTAHSWTGTMRRGDKRGPVVLTRPSEGQAVINPVTIGTWSNNSGSANNCIHIAQAADGSFRAWSDQVQTSGQRYGPHVQRPPTLFEGYGTPAKIRVEPSGLADVELWAYTAMCCSHRHFLLPAPGGNTLKEDWRSEQPGIWKRMPGGSCLWPR